MSETSQTEYTRKNCSRYAWALIAVGSLLRVASFFYSANSGGDAEARVGLTAQWLQSPAWKIIFGGTYPPGHFWLIGFSTLMVHDVLTAGRLLSLGLGIASLILVWKTARLLYGIWGGLLSLGVFSLYSLHIGYSTTTSAEVSAVFFFLAGTYFFFRYFQSGADRVWRLAISGACLSVAQSIRYEPWVLFGGLFLILAVLLQMEPSRRPWRDWLRSMLVFGATGGTWPVFTLAYAWHRFGDPLHLINLNRLAAIKFMAANPISPIHQLALPPSVLLLTLSPLALAGAVYGLAISFSSRLPCAFAGLTIFFGCFLAYEFCTGGMLAVARYTLIPGTMLAIVSGYGLQGICEKFVPDRMSLAHSAIFGLLFLNLVAVLAMSELPNRYAEKFSSISPRLRYQERIRVVGEYLRTHMGAEDAVMIDNYNTESNMIAAAAGIPLLPGDRAFETSAIHDETVDQYIRRVKPRFVVYSDQGTLRRWLNLPPECGDVSLEGMAYHCVFANSIYRVYRIEEPDQN
ncbi:MAG: glycosyltransferase family 39 protein [Terriglobales bacterium]|jgi:hypothetical protein